MLRCVLVASIVFSASCRSAAPLPAPAAAPDASRPNAPAADPDSIRWVRDSVEFRAAVVQAYRTATAHVETARPRKAGTWAVILDADETIISNVTYQLERARLGLGFSPDSWNQWVRRREATPLPGAAAFLSRVRALGGRIAVVTNRLGSECDDTTAVFERHALVYDAMLCRPNGSSPSDKNPRFQAIARGESRAGASPLDVIAYVGDNILDFPDLTQALKTQGEAGLQPFGARYFVIPNPMYGSWQ